MADVVTVWNPFIITNNGLELRQAAIATEKSVKFDYAKIGQGAPSNPSNIPLMTDVVLPAHQVPVVRSESKGVTHFVGVRIDNAKFPQPVLMREIGLFASLGGGAPILYGYTCAMQGYDSIPAGSISHYIWTVGIDTVLSRAQSIMFSYDGSTVYASYDDIDRLIRAFEDFKQEVCEQNDTNFDNLKTALQPLEADFTLVRIEHNLKSYPQVLLGVLQHGLGLGGLGDGPIGGTDTTQRPARAIYHDSSSLTVLTIKSIVQLGAQPPELHLMNSREYTLTWPDNVLDSVFIRLI